jgi:hypothetical protein
MRRTLWPAGAVILGLTLGAPAGANADVADVFDGLAGRNLSPPPLVFTHAPPALSPLDETLTTAPSLRRGGYALRAFRDSGSRSGVILLQRGAFGSVRTAFAVYRRQGFRRRSTRVRGRRGALLTRRLGGILTRALVWSEHRRVYELSSGTPRTVSLRQLRATAAGLDELEGYFIGSLTDAQERYHEGYFAATNRTVSGSVSWTAACTDAGGAPTQYAGTSRVSFVPVRGNGFSFALKDTREDAKPWTGTATGTVGTSSVDVTFRATGSFDGLSCDSGQVSLSLPRSSGD